MKNSILILIFLISTVFNPVVAQTENSEPILKIGLIADIQYGDLDTRGTRFYRNSIGKLREAINDINKNNVHFTINLGDLTDRNPADLDAVIAELGKLDGNVYNVTGNHDYVEVKDNQALYDKLFLPSDYYGLDLPRLGVEFIFLNSNEISSYSNIKGNDEQELVAMKEKLKAEKRINNYSWNGAIGNDQLRWLENKLKIAQNNNTKVVLCLHHPLYPENNHNALNDKEILEILKKYDCVKVVLSGHNHAGNFGYYNNIPFVTVEGMIETENKNAYGIIEVFERKMIIKGKGRVTSRELKF